MNETEEFYKGAGSRYAERGVPPATATRLLDQHMAKIARFIGIGAPPEAKARKTEKPVATSPAKEVNKNIVPMSQRAI
jgi:hypothetical protein